MITIVGFGPGADEHMTAAARAALAACDVCVGYAGYVEQVRHLLPGKAVVATGMTQELDRGREALRLAREGKAVALVSSGDAGVYGMAGLMFEVLAQAGWDPAAPDVPVRVVPGVTALSSAASLLGAPISHDFCAISLSDLMTPWEAIERRLEAAAAADFVVALYNPKSARRDWQLKRAQEILLGHRSPDTPVGVATNACREGQAVALCRLADLADQDVGMLTVVIVGNSQSRAFGPFIVTPRGYNDKYGAGA